MVKPGYKQTEIGAIPEDWEIKYLSHFGNVISGGTPSTSVKEYWDGDIAWCTPSDITATPGKYIYKTERNITIQGLKNCAATILPPNSVLLCTRATIGELKISKVPIATNQGFKNLSSNSSGNIDYLYYLLQAKKKDMLELAIGSTFLEISKTALCHIPLQTPPLDEQERIADVLSDVDELISSLEKLIAKKKAIKQGAMQELLTGKKRLPGFTGEWGFQEMQTNLHFQVGYPFSSDYFNSDGLGLRLIKNRDLKSDAQVYYTTETYDQTFIVRDGDVLVGMDGDFLPCVWKKGISLLNQRVGRIQVTEKMNLVFAYYCLQKPLTELQEGTGATTVKHLSHKDIEKMVIKIPIDVCEQTAIASILSDMDNEIEALEEKLAKTRQVKQGMMQQLLTGKIRLV